MSSEQSSCSMALVISMPHELSREEPDGPGRIVGESTYKYWWGEVVEATCVAAESMALSEILAGWVPSSMPQPWTWDDEERAIFERVCLCCGEVGHHQRKLEDFLAEHGLTEGVCLGGDGRVWDGHHRIVAARRLGIEVLPLESLDDSGKRWLRDYGPVSWENRKTGDMSADLYERR